MRDDRSKCEKWTGHVPEGVERERLAATLGAVLRSLRAAYGVGTRPLARRSTVARSTIQRLEAGQRRPRRSVLAALAYGLDPGRVQELTEALCAAAGPSLRDDTAGGLRRRERRLADARRAVKWEAWRIWQDAENAKQQAFHLTTTVLAKLPLDPMKERMTHADLDRGFDQLAALEAVSARSDRLFAYRDALMRDLSRPRHPLEVNILDWHTARRRARGG
ncbi:helix-turn-helix domain-containing protein [Nonomuraea sp. K274]|uniref:Helix-turn-helix domain-containing protein n=1 Tax=Nonomuraea cypriaca TaxID=1187855 RepID=A0A931EX24_9ACTN|nr:helix-turn-helix transcriptional regulator [Nonomuraea cypriaca]MBF8187309.1 helix-turn-helix domain-containing protein [Nonomuraea cypriaca]